MIEPKVLIQYLQHNGWVLVEQTEIVSHLTMNPGEEDYEGEKIQIDVPMDKSLRDYQKRMVESLMLLSTLQGVPLNFLVAEINLFNTTSDRDVEFLPNLKGLKLLDGGIIVQNSTQKAIILKGYSFHTDKISNLKPNPDNTTDSFLSSTLLQIALHKEGGSSGWFRGNACSSYTCPSSGKDTLRIFEGGYRDSIWLRYEWKVDFGLIEKIEALWRVFLMEMSIKEFQGTKASGVVSIKKA